MYIGFLSGLANRFSRVRFTPAEKARKLIDKDNVAAVMGCYTSASRKAVLPVFEKLNGLLYYPTYYEGLEISPNIMYTAQEATQSSIAATEWLYANRGKSYYLVGLDYIWPRTTMYHSATGEQAPHCIHVVGVGRAGSGYVEGLLRTGEIEDILENSRARVAALVVDIGEDDMLPAKEYAAGFRQRLEERGIPQERFHFESVALEIPERDDLFNTLRRLCEFLKLEYPRYYWNPNYEPWLPSAIKLPKTGDHVPRAVAKAVYAKAYYDGGRPMEKALQRFVNHIEEAELLSMVLACFSLNGGTGSGMIVDLARHLASVKLGRRPPVVGVGQRIANEVTNKVAQDSFMQFAEKGDGKLLFRALRPAGFTGAPHETVSGKSRNWTLYNLSKFTHPGVQVPGEDSTIQLQNHEFFDHLTSYADIILPGMAKTDLDIFWKARDEYDKFDWDREASETFLVA